MHTGIPFNRGGVGVMLSAADGRLLALSSGLDIAPPESVTVSVPEESATAAAITYASHLDSSSQPAETQAELRIVVPNSYWARRGLGEEIAEPGSRVAWVVELREAEGHYRIFWIDAADARLLGGTQSKSAVPATRTRSASTTSTRLPHRSGGVDGPAARPFAIAIPAAIVVVALVAGTLLLARRAAALRCFGPSGPKPPIHAALAPPSARPDMGENRPLRPP
jgi:hypothetical protein